MLLHSKVASSSVNGPGNRAVIWLAGCDLGCAGCWNPETHAFDTKKETDIDDVVAWVKTLTDIEGITFSGGEPMQQAPSTYVLMHKIREARPELSMGMFTGYASKELEDGRYKWKSRETADWKRGTTQLWHEIKKMLDFAVTGRYNQRVPTTDDAMRGSLNQEIKYFTDRYKPEDMPEQAVEVNIDDDGLIQITGFPNEEFRKEFPVEGETFRPKPSPVPVPNSNNDEETGEDLVCA